MSQFQNQKQQQLQLQLLQQQYRRKRKPSRTFEQRRDEQELRHEFADRQKQKREQMQWINEYNMMKNKYVFIVP